MTSVSNTQPLATGPPTDIAANLDDDTTAQNGFTKSIMVSGIRCLLTYIVLPFITPLYGLAPQVGPVVGLAVGIVAIVANVFSIRRFWKADHRWKKHITVLHLSVITLLVILLYRDIAELLQ